MKKYLALLLAVMLLLSACGTKTQDDPTPSQTEEPVVQTDAVLRLAVDEAAGFDPYNCQSSCNRLILELVLQPLFTVSAEGEAMPVLAKGWSVSDDGKTTTVYLRDDVTFHDGVPLTADIVINSVEKAKNGDFYAGRFRYLTEVAATGTGTVTFRTEKAYECFPLLLDIPLVSGEGENPVGSGPFAFYGSGLAAWEGWLGQRPTAARAVTFVPVSAAEEIRDSFQYGGISAAWLDPNAPGALDYNGNHALWSIPTTVLQYVGFNLKSGPFASGGLRSAVTYAVDRTAIVREDMGGAGVAAPLAALPGSRAESGELAARVTYDPQKLQAVAANYGGREAVMIVSGPGSQRAKTAQRIADSLTACGLPVTVKALAPEKFKSALQNGDFDLYLAEIKLSPDLDLTPLFGASGYGGLGSYSEVRALCDLARANVGNAYDLQNTILTDGLLCPVAFKHMELHIHHDALQGIAPKLGGWIFTE